MGMLFGAGIVSPAHAQAVNLNLSVNNIIADGRTKTNITTTGNHSRITTETVSSGVGFNTFSDFQQAAGTRVDLMVPDAAGSLVNIVSNGAVVINGELNSIKNGAIGGNIFFSSSNGFIVGQNGRVNVGSLTVNTPTQEFLDRVMRSNGTVNDAVALQLMRGEIPMSPNGQIAIMGKVNATGSITLQGHTVNVTGDRGPLTFSDLGQRTKFDSTVNSTGLIEGGALVASGGQISIVATGGSRIGGKVDTSGATASSKAGKISITGGDITVDSGAQVSAAGDAGGEIIVFAGGTLAVEDGASFDASGLGAGDGGFIELSGRDAHIGAVSLNLSSRVGAAGTLLIDPFNLFIGGISSMSGPSDDASVSTNILSFGANIRLEADNSITVVAGGVIDSRIMTAGVSTGNSGSITLEAPTITLEDGSKVLAGITTGAAFTGGDVTFNATRTNGGTSSIVIGNGGALGPELTGRNITLSATSAVNQSSLLLALPSASALISTLGGTVEASGTFTATATATGAGGLTLLPLGVVVTNVASGVEIKGNTALSAAAIDVTVSSAVTSSIVTQSLAPANSSVDGAVAVSTINSTAIARLGGSAVVNVTGDTSLIANNTVTSTSDATPMATAFGASVGVSVVNAITTSEIVDAAALTTNTLTMGATTATDVTVNAVAGAGGATEPSPGTQATTYLTDARYGGQATTQDGGVSVAGALAISDLTSTTSAGINSTLATNVTGAVNIATSSENKATVTADGSAVTSDTGVGVALGINLAKVKNDAVIASVLNAGSASLSALRPTAGNAFMTTATSGAGAKSVGIAGSFALNLVDTQSVARLASPAVVTVTGGAVALTADNGTESTASAAPTGAGAVGATVGVGASVALNIVANRSVTEIADGGVVTGAGDLGLDASGTHAVVTRAEAGSAGGVSITPALALSMVNNTTTARLGSGGTQTVAGAVTVRAAQTSSITTEASGKAAGSDAAIGAALALALVDDRALATTARNVTAGGAVSFVAAGASLSSLKAEASAKGAAAAEDDGTATDGGDVDTTATGALTSGADRQAASGVGDADQQAATSATAADEDGRSASTSEGKVSVAAAVGINVQTSQVDASIPDNVVISAGGVLTLAALNNTDGKIEALGDAVGEDGATSEVGIGAAVAVNVVKTRNTAVLGNAAHRAGGLSLSATKRDVAAFMADPASTAVRTDVYLSRATSGAGGGNVGIAGSVALNLLDTQSVARVSGGAVVTVTGGGNVSLTTDNQTDVTAEALPIDTGAVGATVGVGASVALNIVANRSVTEIADGGVVTGAGDLGLDASGTHAVVTRAEAGSAGGVSITPALALSMVNNTTTARLGSGGTQTVAGAVTVRAAQTSSITTEASGKAAGSDAAIGAALALALVDDRALATTARNVTAGGAVSFVAAGASLSSLKAEASAKGAAAAEDDGTATDGGDVDTTATGALTSGADRQAASGVGDADQQAATSATAADEDGRSASTSEGKVSVAAAVGINVQTSQVDASIPDNVVISAGGVLTLAALNNTDGKIEALGDAVGEDGATSEVGIGAAVAVNVVKTRNTAVLGNAAHRAGGLSLSATKRDVAAFMADPASTAVRTDVYLSRATSGAGGGNVGIAGSVALNLLDTQSVARVSGGAVVTVTGGGNVSLTTDNQTDVTAEALPIDTGAVGATVGVGASVALNIVANRSVAEIADGGVVTGAGDLGLDASGTHAVVTRAEAGSAGGVSITPALALSMVNNTTTARLGSGGTQTVAGAVTVRAAQTSSITTEASGKAAGSDAAIGAALALALVDDRALATTARNVTAGGAVSFVASGISSSTLSAIASASGAKDSEDADAAPTSTGGDSVDRTATSEFQSGAGKQQASGVGDTQQRSSTSAEANDESGRSAETSEGKVAVAAAVAINVQKSQVNALVPDGVSVSAGGAITVASSATTSGAATSDGQAVTGEDGGTSEVGIGVAVSVNVVKETNTAYLGAAVHSGAGVNVRALQATGAPTDTFLASATSGAGGSKVGIAGSIALNIVTLDTTARIAGGATVAAGAGASSIRAGNTVSATAKAEPSDEGVTGGKVGVGASFAMNLITTTTTAELQNGATLTGGTGLAVEAISGLDTTTEASAGAAGGIAVDASVALALLNQTTVARIGAGNALSMGAGAVSAIATNTGVNIAKSTGENKSDKVGVGASASVILGNGASGGALKNTSLTSATLARSVTAGAVTLTASANRTYDANATATAGGGDFSSNDEKKNDKTGGTSTTADSLDKTKDSQRDQDGNSSGSKVTIAAAAGIAAAQDVVTATLEGVTINASGAVSITATNTVGMTASGIGAAKDPNSKVGIGVGVGLAILNNTTTANVANSALITNASGLAVTATSRENASEPYRSKLSALGIAGASGKDVAVAGALAVAISTGKTEAKIGNNVTVANGGAMSVAVDNESHLSAKALAGSVSTSGVAVGGSIAVIVSQKDYEASVGTNTNLTGSALSVTAINRKIEAATPDFDFTSLDDLDAFGDLLADLATGKLLGNSNYYVEAIGGAGGSGVAVQGSFGVMVFSDNLTAAVGSNSTVNVGTGAVTLSSGGDFVAKSLSGALSASTSSAAVGVSATVVISSGTTVSRLAENARITSAGSFTNTASAKQDIRSYAASASAASSAGIAGVAGVVTSNNRVEALMDRGARVTISGAGAVSLTATNTFDIFGLAAGVGVGGTAGIGAAATVVVVNNTTRAALGDGTSAANRAEINANGQISISATATENGDLFSVAGAAGANAGVGAGAGIYVLGTTTEALVGDFAKVGNSLNSGSLNISASDTSRLFAVAGAAGAGGTAGAGAGIAVGVINKTITAEIGASTLIESGNVVVDAKSAEDLFNITAGVGVGGTAGLAGAVTVLAVNPTTTARIGASSRVLANGNVAVLADSKTEIDLLDGAFAAGTAGVGASIGVTVINATTLATVDANAQVTALGNGATQSFITGYASSFANYGSSGGFSAADFKADSTDELTDANAASARSVGLSLLTKQRTSVPTTATARGVIVNASDKTSVRALSVAGAVGAVGVAISASVPVITTNTKAQIGAGAQINRIAGVAAATQNVNVGAASDVYTLGFSGAVAGGSVGVGAGASVMVIDTTTEATVAAGQMTANGDVVVAAKATQDLVGIGAAGSAGTVGVSGGISVIDITTKTKATLAGTVTAQGNVDVIADDVTRTGVLAGALAVGYVGVGAAISVVNLDKEINAAIISGSTVSALGLRGDHTVLTGNSFSGTRTASRGINVQSNSQQSGFTLGVAGTAGGVGVSGVITLYLMDVKNTASIGNNVSINTAGGNLAAGATQDVVITARDETITSVAAGGIAVGVFGGIAGVVDVGVFKNTAAASIGDNVTLNAKRDVLVSGLSNKAGEAYVIGAGGGIVGLAAGIAIYNYGDGVAPGGEADKNIGEASDDGSLNFSSITADAQAQASDGTANQQLAASDDARVIAVSQAAQDKRAQIDIASAASTLSIPAGTSASIGSGTINAGGTVGVNSSDALNVKITTGAVAIGAVGGGAGIGVLTVDTGSTAQIDGSGTLTAGAVTVNALTVHTLAGLHFAGSGGLLAAISADVGVHTDNSRTTAVIRRKDIRKTIGTTGTVAVNASSTRNVDVDAIGVSVAGTLAVGASVGTATVGGSVTAAVTDGATIGTSGARMGSVAVTASAVSSADTEAYAVGGGIGAAIQGAGSFATVKPTVTASVNSAQIFTTGLTNVSAGATGSSDTLATGIAVAGGLAAGASLAESEVSSNVSSTVSNGALIDAGSITIGTSAGTGIVRSKAIGAAGALVGLNATVTKSRNFTNANTAVTGSTLASSGNTTVSATNITGQLADGSGLAVGFVAAGFNISEAKSETTTTAVLTNLTSMSAGSLNVVATGIDTNTAVTVAGSGGLVAGSAATSKTSTVSTTRAAADTSGAAAYGMNIAGDATIAAIHTSNFGGSVDSTQASLVGASGANLSHVVSSTVDAAIGQRVQFTARNLTLSARNITLNPFLLSGGNNVRSISGGLANVPAGGADVLITHNTTASIGANAAVRITKPGTGPSTLKQEAYNNIVSKQKVNLDSGGAIALANAEIDAVVTANATASIGAAADVEVDYGDIKVAAWGEGDFDMRSSATTYGLAGAPSGDANITYTGQNTVTIGNNALLQATDGDNPTNGDTPRFATVTIGAGTGPSGETANLIFNATVDIFNKTAIPIPTGPNPTVIVRNSGLITVGSTSSTNMALDPQGVRAAGDIRLNVSKGNIDARAVGTGKDIYREGLAKAASAISNAFGGGDVSFDYKGGSTSIDGGISRVDVNGRVETGIQSSKTLIIDETCSPTLLSCIANNATGNIEFVVSGPNPVGTEVLARVAELQQLIEDYDTDPIAKAAYQNEIRFLQNKLVGLGLGSFNGSGVFVPGTYAGPSPRAALQAAAAVEANNISTVKVQLELAAPTNIVASLTELVGGVQEFYTDATFGLTATVNTTISQIQAISTYSAGTHGGTVAGLQTLRDQGLAAANAAKVAEADTISRRNTNIAKATEIATAQSTLEAALLANNAGNASTQQGIIAAAQTVIANNLTIIASNTATITTQTGNARDRAASLKTGLTNLLNSLPANAVTGTDAEQALAISRNNADTAIRNNLNAAGSSADFFASAGALTRVGLSSASLGTAITDLTPVLSAINSAVTSLNANTGATAGTVTGTKSLTQFVGILGSLTTSFTTITQSAAAASASSGVPQAYTIEVADTAARLGNIFVTGDQLRTTAAGKMLAPGNAEIKITNNTHHTLKLGNLIVPTYDAGNVRFNGVLVYSPANITSLNASGLNSGFTNENVVTSRTSSRGLVEIISTYTPEAFPLAQREIAPDIILKRGSVIENTNGAVRIISEAGNVYIQGTINAGSVEILAKDGDFVASYVNGFNHIGGDPASFTNPTSASLGEIGPGITANGAISISARYLNINSTIQSGIAEWNLTLGNTPTLTASAAAIGVSQADLDAANLAGAATVRNSERQDITISRAAAGIDPAELKLVVEQYKDEVIVNPNADPVRTIAIFGIATQVNIKDYLSENTSFSLQFTKAQAEAFAAANGSTDGIFSVVRTSATDNIGASYDAKNGQYLVNGASVKGGYIQLFGQIMNTTSSTAVGRLNVLDGFGTININNSSNIPVLLRNLSAGEDIQRNDGSALVTSGTLRGVEGLIEITDIIGLNTTNANNPIVSVRKTVFTRDYVPGQATGVVRVETQTGTIDNATGNLLLGGVGTTFGGDRTSTYAPNPNQRYVWTTGEEFKRTSKYSKVDTQLFGAAALTVNSITSLTLNGTPQLLNTYRLADGTYVTTQSTLTGGGLKISNGAAFQDPESTSSLNTSLAGTQLSVANDSTFTKDEFVNTGASSRRCNWWTLCIASEKTFYYELRQEYTTIITESLKADYPIGVNFIGSNTGAITITSTNADVILTSNLNAVAGIVTINAGSVLGSGASIIQGDLAGEIKAKNISLTADRSVGGVTNPHVLNAPVDASVTVNLTGTTGAGFGALSANAKDGKVSIISRGDLIVDQVTAAGSVAAGKGTIDIFSFGSIDGRNQTSRIQAPRVTLSSLSGSVGNTTTGSLLRVNTGFSTNPSDRPFGDPEVDPAFDANARLGFTITAAGDIGVRSDGWTGNTDGNALLVKVLTTGGDVRVAATGQILDNNPVESIDQRTYSELLGFWESLGLLANDPSRGINGTANEDKQQNAIVAFEASTTQTYNQYWRIRGTAAYDAAATVTIDPASAQYRALDAQFRATAVEVGNPDPDAFVATSIAKVEAQQTSEYHRLHGVVGDLTASYDTGYTYVATDAQKSELTRGSVWTERELAFSLAPGALKTVTGTNPVLKDPNVSGRTVTIEADRGIGETVGAGTATLGVSIRSDLDPRNLTLDQKVALAAAERNDLLLTVGPVNLPANATAQQLAAYDAAVALGLGAPGVLTSLNLGAEFDTLTGVQQAALNAAALGLISAPDTLLTVLSKRPVNFNAVTALNLTVPNVSSGTNADIGGAFVASRGNATLGNISTFGDTRIKVYGNIINAPVSAVQTGNLILEAAQGRIGTTSTPLTLSPRGTSSTTARAQNGVNIAFTDSGRIDTVYSPQDVKLVAQNSLFNAQDDELINVLGGNVDLQAVTGSIGTVVRSLNVGVGLGGQITANAANEINLFGSANNLFIIGSANASGTIRLAAAGEGVIDGLVETAGTINIATGGRTLFTTLGDVHSIAGLVDINSGSLKMLNGAMIRADADQVIIATADDALVTGITSASGLANAVSVTAGGRIFAGTADPRFDITAMAPGAGVFLSAGLGIGDRTQSNVSALDNTVTLAANPLRIRTNVLAATATDGGIDLLAQTDMTLTNLSAANGQISVTGLGTLDVTFATSGGSQNFDAQVELNFGNLTTTGLPAVPGPEDAGDITLVSNLGDVTGGIIGANGSASLTGIGVTFTKITAGIDNTVLAKAGPVTGGDVDAGGSSDITGLGVTVNTVLTGIDSTLTGGTGQVEVVTSVTAGGTSTITGNGVLFDTIIAGTDSVILSTGDIIGQFEQAGETIRNIAGFGPGNTGILDVKVMRAKNIDLQATGTLDVGQIEVAENLTLRADIIRATDITQVPSGPDPLNVTLTGANGTAATFAQLNVDAPAGVVMPQVFVSETQMTTTAEFVDIINAAVPIQGGSPMAGTLLLTTPSQTVFVDDRSVTPKPTPASNVQLFLDGNPFALTLNGSATATNSFVVVYDRSVQVTDLLGVPYDGISLTRDTVRNMRYTDDLLNAPSGFDTGEPSEDDELNVSEDDTVVQIGGIAYSVFVQGNGPAVRLRR